MGCDVAQTYLLHRPKLSRLASQERLRDALVRRDWCHAGGGSKERLGCLSQTDVANERSRPLRKQILFCFCLLAMVFAWLIHITLGAQLLRWEHQPEDAIRLSGPESSFLAPVIVSFWYLLMFFGMTRRSFAGMLPKGSDTFFFEALVSYNVFQAAMNAYVIVSVFREAYVLQFALVGNSALVHGEANRRLAILVILHYRMRILELLDTCFLILRDKVGRSLTLHVVLRLQNIWGWHIACCYGCGGDIYFPMLTNAVGSLVLHLHYAMAVLEPHTGQLCWPFKHVMPSRSNRRKVVTAVHVWVFRVCLIHALLAFVAGAYPRLVIVVQITQMLFGLILYSEFHYKGSGQTTDRWQQAEEPHTANLVFSFDSCGWCFLYHFGVAMWIQDNFQEELARGEFAFSGSSGGAIVATGLASDCNMGGVVESLLKKTWPKTHLRPWLLPNEIQTTLDQFVCLDAHARARNRLRVLLTRVSMTPPFFMGEVCETFESREHLFNKVMASSHMPFVMGFGFPMDGGRYIDGLLWANAFVPWRAFSKNQRLCRVSAFSALGADIGPRLHAIPPPWWPAFPPSPEALEGLMWAGYKDVAAVFGSGDGRYSGCGPCARRQQISSDARLTRASSARVDELIQIYERTAQRHWAIVVGSFVAVTVSLLAVCVRVLALR